MKIERNIPAPEKTGKPLGYPWPKMVIGDSILVNESKAGPYAIRALRSWHAWSRRNGITDRRITTRSLGKGRVRVRMIAKEGSK